MLVGIWHVLSDPDAHFIDLGLDHHRNTEAVKRQHVHQLEVLGFYVTLEPTA